MPKRKSKSGSQISIGDIRDVSGEVNIAAGDIYQGYTPEQVSILLTQISSKYQRKPFDGRCPYKGLEVFEEADANLFFGRERLVNDLINRVKVSRTIFITGPSGSGKSSLVRAGLIHALKQGAIKNSERWLYEAMIPGRDPLNALALAFSRLKSPELANYFREHTNEPYIMHECAESILSGNKDQQLVLLIDQFEESFTQVDQAQREIFINLLTHAALIENGRVVILFAMRSDFVSSCALYPQLNNLLNQQFVQVGAMQPDELVNAIAQPALSVGLRIDPDLIAQIIHDMEGEPGTLPLMQFALKDLFDAEKAKGGMLSLTREALLRQGGLHRSLERHADAVFSRLSMNEQELARFIFSRLIEIGHGTQDTRREVLLEELVPANGKIEGIVSLVQKLADARLLTTYEQNTKETVTISHEKLIDAWPWLKKLVNENQNVIALQNEISRDAKEWDDHHREESYLYRGVRLGSIREQLEASKLVLSELALAFVRAGISVYSNELEAAKARATQLKRRAVYLTFALSAALIAIGVAVVFGVREQRQAKIALSRQLATQALTELNQGSDRNALLGAALAAKSLELHSSFTGVEAANRIMELLPKLIFTTTSGQHDSIFDYSASLAFDNSAKHIMLGDSERGEIRIWDIGTGKLVATMRHQDVEWVKFSPINQQVVSASPEHVYVWDANTGSKIDEVQPVHVDPGVAGQKMNVVIDWERLKSSRSIRPPSSIQVEGEKYTYVAVNQGGTLAAYSNYSGVVVWDLEKLQVNSVFPFHRKNYEYARFAAFSAQSNRLAIVTSWATVYVFDTKSATEVFYKTNDQYVSGALAISSNGRFVAFTTEDHVAHIWDIQRDSKVAQIIQETEIQELSFSPDERLIASESTEGIVSVWELDHARESIDTSDSNFRTAETSNKEWKVMKQEHGIVTLTALAKTNQATSMDLGTNVLGVTFTGDSRWIIVTRANENNEIISAQTLAAIPNWTHVDDYDLAPYYSNDQSIVSVTADTHHVAIRDKGNNKILWQMTFDNLLLLTYISPDEKYAIAGGTDKIAQVWDINSGEELLRMNHRDDVIAAGFSADSLWAFSSSTNNDEDLTIQTWNPNILITELCSRLPRNLSREEWKEYIGDALPYQPICPNLPILSDVIPTP